MNEKKIAENLKRIKQEGVNPYKAFYPRSLLSIAASLICLILAVYSLNTEIDKNILIFIWFVIGMFFGKLMFKQINFFLVAKRILLETWLFLLKRLICLNSV